MATGGDTATQWAVELSIFSISFYILQVDYMCNSNNSVAIPDNDNSNDND